MLHEDDQRVAVYCVADVLLLHVKLMLWASMPGRWELMKYPQQVPSFLYIIDI